MPSPFPKQDKTLPFLFSHKYSFFCSEFSLQNQPLTSPKSEVRWLGQVAFNAAASCWTKRRAPLWWGGCLIVEAGASSNQACMGLGLNGPKSWALANGLGFKWVWLKFECFGPKPKASDLSNSLWRSFGFSCIWNSYFLIIGPLLRASDQECLQFYN